MASINNSDEQIEAAISQANTYIAGGEIDKARDYLISLIDLDETSEEVWWLLATISDDDDLQICLENVLDLNPNNQRAWHRLKEYSLKLYIQRRIEGDLFSPPNQTRNDLRQRTEELFNTVLAEEEMFLTKSEREELFASVIADLLGFGSLEPLLGDDTVAEIFVKDKNTVYVVQNGKLIRTGVQFDSELHLRRTIDRIVEPVGLELDELVDRQSKVAGALGASRSAPTKTTQHPHVVDELAHIHHLRLSNGNQYVITTPISGSNSYTVTVKKFDKTPFTIQDLIRFGSMTPKMADFLRACVIAQFRILVVGGAGSGKNTLVNALCSFIPNDERIITLERLAEYQLQQEHVITLEGATDIPTTILLNHHPDRLIFGELTAHEMPNFVDAALCLPVMGMVRARSVAAALRQLEIAMLQAMPESNLSFVQNLISRSFELVVLMRLFPDGSRKVAEIVEMAPSQDETYNQQTLFQFEQTGLENGKIIGRIRPTGNIPKFLDRLQNAGISLVPDVFGV